MDIIEKIKPIEKYVLIDQVLSKIVGIIESGELNPGDCLPGERELAEKLRISRTTLRQALKALNILGVLETAPGKKTFVKDSFSDFLISPFRLIKAAYSLKTSEIFEARRVLEESLTVKAAENHTKNQVIQLKKYCDMAENNIENKEKFVYGVFMFHKCIAQMANNKILYAVINSIFELMSVIEEYEFEQLSIEERKKSIRQHKEIYDAIKERDAEKSRLKMHGHLNLMESRLEKIEFLINKNTDYSK
jgi:GntR family transcriptional regulator, transcriptional repressor for pyruvate dehydrogenase complex